MSITFRRLGAGESHLDATHFWHARTDSVFTREQLDAAGFGSDCVLPLVKVVDGCRADRLPLGSRIVLDALPGVPASTVTVTSLELVGDDVLINGGRVTISRSNLVRFAPEVPRG